MAPESVPSSERRYGGLTRAQRDAQRRQRLLEAGLDEYGTAGYAATTVEAVCSTAGVSTRNFYDHFPGSESLLIAIFDEGVERAQAATVAALTSLPEGASVRERAHAGLAAFAAYMLGDERRARINFVEVVGASRMIEARRRAAFSAFASILLETARGLSDRGLIMHRPDHLLKVASTALVGAVVETLVDWMSADEPRVPLEQILDDLVELMTILAGDAT